MVHSPCVPQGYLLVPLQRPEEGQSPDGRKYFYSANDASVGDVDGDGQYEIILKWDPSNAHDNAHDGYTGPTLFDCYRLDGTLLWRINMGINIRSGAHYVPFIVYDLDGRLSSPRSRRSRPTAAFAPARMGQIQS